MKNSPVKFLVFLFSWAFALSVLVSPILGVLNSLGFKMQDYEILAISADSLPNYSTESFTSVVSLSTENSFSSSTFFEHTSTTETPLTTTWLPSSSYVPDSSVTMTSSFSSISAPLSTLISSISTETSTNSQLEAETGGCTETLPATIGQSQLEAFEERQSNKALSEEQRRLLAQQRLEELNSRSRKLQEDLKGLPQPNLDIDMSNSTARSEAIKKEREAAKNAANALKSTRPGSDREKFLKERIAQAQARVRSIIGYEAQEERRRIIDTNSALDREKDYKESVEGQVTDKVNNTIDNLKAFAASKSEEMSKMSAVELFLAGNDTAAMLADGILSAPADLFNECAHFSANLNAFYSGNFDYKRTDLVQAAHRTFITLITGYESMSSSEDNQQTLGNI